MRDRLHKCLLFLVILCVAGAPLRGAWALPDMETPAGEPHCAGMQHDMQQHAGHGDKRDESKPHQCKSGCNGSCCDQNCAACLHHATAAISGNLFQLRDPAVRTYAIPVADSFPERPPTPLLRPPLASRS